MAQSTLIVYDPLENAPEEERSYWLRYVEFYEKYWGGPMSPFGVWFGNEYDSFRRAISEHLSIGESALRDCFFIRSNDGILHVCPLGGNASGRNGNILSCENAVPFEWLAAFDEPERRNFYSHWGFSSMYYTARVGDACERLAVASDTIAGAIGKTDHEKLRAILEWMEKGAAYMSGWFSGRDGDGYAVLNYGDVCSVVSPQSLDRERSVEQAAEIFTLLRSGEWEKSYGLASRLFRKWEDLRNMLEATGGGKPLQ